MKCDELETEQWLDYGGEPMPCYPAKDVDEAIAELKAENKRLKRALWLARAEIAHKKMDEYWPDYCHNAHSRIALLKWEKVERKCLKKAEEYK